MLTITRRFEFCAANRIYNPDWSDEKNADVFGPCANLNGQGHNYELEVTVSGEIDPETGMIMNLRHLKQLVQEHVVNDLDHKNLNLDVPWFQAKVPSSEYLVEAIWERLDPVIGGQSAQLEKLMLRETANNYVTRTRS